MRRSDLRSLSLTEPNKSTRILFVFTEWFVVNNGNRLFFLFSIFSIRWNKYLNLFKKQSVFFLKNVRLLLISDDFRSQIR